MQIWAGSDKWECSISFHHVLDRLEHVIPLFGYVLHGFQGQNQLFLSLQVNMFALVTLDRSILSCEKRFQYSCVSPSPLLCRFPWMECSIPSWVNGEMISKASWRFFLFFEFEFPSVFSCQTMRATRFEWMERGCSFLWFQGLGLSLGKITPKNSSTSTSLHDFKCWRNKIDLSPFVPGLVKRVERRQLSNCSSCGCFSQGNYPQLGDSHFSSFSFIR